MPHIVIALLREQCAIPYSEARRAGGVAKTPCVVGTGRVEEGRKRQTSNAVVWILTTAEDSAGKGLETFRQSLDRREIRLVALPGVFERSQRVQGLMAGLWLFLQLLHSIQAISCRQVPIVSPRSVSAQGIERRFQVWTASAG